MFSQESLDADDQQVETLLERLVVEGRHGFEIPQQAQHRKGCRIEVPDGIGDPRSDGFILLAWLMAVPPLEHHKTSNVGRACDVCMRSIERTEAGDDKASDVGLQSVHDDGKDLGLDDDKARSQRK